MSSCTFLDCCSWLNPWKGGKDTFVFPKMGNTPIFGWFIMEKPIKIHDLVDCSTYEVVEMVPELLP